MQSNKLAALAMTIGLAACSAPNNALAPAALPNDAAAKTALALYVANIYGIDVHTLDGNRLLRSLTGNGFGGLAFDKAANLYALAYNRSSTSIAFFPPGATTPSYTLKNGPLYVKAMAISPSDDALYVANVRFPNDDRGQINVYTAGSATPKRTIRTGNRLRDLAFDGSGNLYLLEATPSYSAYFIAVYKPGTSVPLREIQGLSNPGTIATDLSGNLYVTNCKSNGKTCSISVYPPGASQPNRVITSGLRSPFAIAFNGSGDLYVGNQKLRGGTIAVYAPGATAPKHIIPAIPGSDPIELEFNPNGDLYVLYSGRSVTVYGRGMHLRYTIPQSVTPAAIAIGPG